MAAKRNCSVAFRPSNRKKEAADPLRHRESTQFTMTKANTSFLKPLIVRYLSLLLYGPIYTLSHRRLEFIDELRQACCAANFVNAVDDSPLAAQPLPGASSPLLLAMPHERP